MEKKITMTTQSDKWVVKVGDAVAIFGSSYDAIQCISLLKSII
jgi:hypothetical protein